MTDAHTPAPWGRSGNYVMVSEGTIAFCPPPDTGFGGVAGMHANARLIAAAPGLLKACRLAIGALKGREHDGFLRDAIEAATGERT